MTKQENAEQASEGEPEGEKSFDLGPTQSGVMGGGASGPRDLRADEGDGKNDGDIDPDKAGRTEQTGGSGTGTQGSSNVGGQRAKGTGQHPAPPERAQEEIENYGSRRDDA